MSQPLADNTLGGSTDPLKSVFQTQIEKLQDGAQQCLGGQAGYAVNIASDVIAIVDGYGTYELTSQTGSADDLTNVNGTFGTIGFDDMVIMIAPAVGHTITVKHNAGGNGQIYLAGGADLVLSGRQTLVLRARYGGGLNQWDELTNSNLQSLIVKLAGAATYSQLTIANAGENITPTQFLHTVETYGGGAADDLKWLDSTNDVKLVLLLAADDTHVVTVKHNVAGDGKIQLAAAADKIITTTSGILLHRTGSAGSYIYKEILLGSGGSSDYTVQSKSADFTATPGFIYRIDTSGGRVVATIVASASYVGKLPVWFEVVDATNELEIAFTGGEKCQDETKFYVRDKWGQLGFQSINSGGSGVNAFRKLVA